jgi:hypothetical protein
MNLQKELELILKNNRLSKIDRNFVLGFLKLIINNKSLSKKQTDKAKELIERYNR